MRGLWLQAAFLKLLHESFVVRLAGELLARNGLSVLCFEGVQELGPVFRKHRGLFSVSFGKGIDLHFGVDHDLSSLQACSSLAMSRLCSNPIEKSMPNACFAVSRSPSSFESTPTNRARVVMRPTRKAEMTSSCNSAFWRRHSRAGSRLGA